jgi:hypothetical protein
MTTIIEIASIRPPKEGKKVATVVAATGQSFNIFPDKLAKFGLTEGARYVCDVEERDFQNRTYRTITRAKPAEPSTSAQVANGNAKSIPISITPPDVELAFVSSALNAFITAGKIGLDARELGQATQLLRLLWSHTFGEGGGTFRASEAKTLKERLLADIPALGSPHDVLHWSLAMSRSADALPKADQDEIGAALQARQKALLNGAGGGVHGHH